VSGQKSRHEMTPDISELGSDLGEAGNNALMRAADDGGKSTSDQSLARLHNVALSTNNSGR
jgi:hypothetical protein